MIKWLMALLVSLGIVSAPVDSIVKKELPYEKYSFENLAKRGGVASVIKEEGNKFYYISEGRRISGEVLRPKESEPVGTIVMARGYVDKEIYKTGMGTHNAAKYYAEQGYVTYAPDFSGYGESDPEDLNALGARLSKPVEMLDLIASIGGDKPIFLWGHSNGGQIMLSVVEILSRFDVLRGFSSKYGVRGVTLWAPVSKPFPYNILFYTDEASDSGKWLRGQVAEFERDYDVFDYSIDKYLDWISIPIQIHQGSADDSVPKKWSMELSNRFSSLGIEHTYYEYPGADHNMRGAWDSVVARDSEWFGSLVR